MSDQELVDTIIDWLVGIICALAVLFFGGHMLFWFLK